MLGRQLERLARAGFQILPAFEIATHYVIERAGYAALVERRPDGSFGERGSPGLLTDSGLAALVWKGPTPLLVTRGREQPATPGQVEELRRFGAELAEALA
jgi:hypothetical protein